MQFYPQNNPLQPLQFTNGQADIPWWDSLLTQMPDNNTGWYHLIGQVQQLDANDKKTDEAQGFKNKKQAELNRLRDFERQITILNTQKRTALSNIATGQQLINNFQMENAQLIANVQAEKAVIAKNQEIVAAYATFVHKLTSYNNGLPAHLVAGQLV